MTGTIPVYWGATDLGEFDERGIIKLTDDFDIGQLSPELYQDMLPYAEKNYDVMKSLEMADDELANKIL